MKEHEGMFPVTFMCRYLHVCRSSYYRWKQNPISKRAQQDIDLTSYIKHIFTEGRATYGSRTIKQKLLQNGIIASRRRISRLMRQADLHCKTKRTFTRTTDSNHSLYVAPDLLKRNFNPAKPNSVWAGDITYIPTNEGFLYLATVMDLYSRKIVGWSMKSHMKADLVNDALTMALFQRKPPKGLIFHTDRGSQYCASSHRNIVQDHGIIQSMSRKGNCWDNAPAESFFSILKRELEQMNQFKNQKQAAAHIFEYIEVFYNRIRAHSTIGYLSPSQFEENANPCQKNVG